MDEPIARFNDDHEQCPNCASKKIYCWDEQVYDFEDRTTGEEFIAVIGYMTCENCGKQYCDGWPINADRIGDF